MTMEVINVPQGSPEWLELRRKHLGGSDAAAAMGLSPYKTPYQLFLEKTGKLEPPDLSNVPAVRLGKAAEPLARAWYENEHNVVLFPTVARLTECPVALASFDGLDEANEPVEIKCVTPSGYEEVAALQEDSERFAHYRIQVDHQLLVSGAAKGRLAFFLFEEELDERGWRKKDEHGDVILKMTAKPIIFVIHRDEARLAAHKKALLDFWKLVESDKAPPMDPARDVLNLDALADETRAEAEKIVTEYAALNDEIEALELQVAERANRQKTLEKRIIDIVGAYPTAKLGRVQYSRFSVKGNVDNEALYKKFGITSSDLDSFRKASRTQHKFTVGKAKPVAETPADDAKVA